MKADKKLSIGYESAGYPSRRNIIGKVPSVSYRRVSDWRNAVSRALYFRLPFAKKQLFRANFRFHLNRQKNVNLLHFFNTINFDKKAFVTTFESTLPIYLDMYSNQHEADVEKALKVLASTRCKKIIALSACAKNIELARLALYPDYEKTIRAKMTTLLPPQAALIDSLADKKLSDDGSIRFLFVGQSFYRKGGLEILRAFDRVKKEYDFSLQLTLVGNIEKLDKTFTHYTEAERDKAKVIITENSDWITHFSYMENAELLEEMTRSQVGLLPTWSDTFGYSVLEFQAAGCPVISTDVRALPEINDNDRGWLIKLSKDTVFEAICATPADRKIVSQTITNKLEEIIVSIFAHPEIIAEKAEKSLSAIKQHHSPENFAEKLNEIYQEALD